MAVNSCDVFESRLAGADAGDLFGRPRMGAGAFSVGNPAQMTFLDVACSMPLGWNGDHPVRARTSSLEEVCARVWSPCFGRGPCYIPFSGGRESSMWLATATRYARGNGHDDPIPVTLRYPGLVTDEELQVQERVVAHLGLADWERIESDDLDLVGPVARSILTRTGPMWPANAHTMAPLVEAARDGVFVFITGLTDFFSWWMWVPLVSVLERHRRPIKRDVALAAAALLPVSLRARVARGRAIPPPMPWLRPAAERDAFALLRRRQADVPLRCDRAMTAQVTHRCFDGAAGTLGAICETFGTAIEQPLRRPDVVEAFAGAAGWRGFRGLKTMLLAMCADVLPEELFAKRPGADLTRIFFGESSRDFASTWTGTGLDESVVNPEALRREWLSDTPDPRTACLLQYAWLTEAARSTPTESELLLTNANQREAP
jgi:hypothetical protein